MRDYAKVAPQFWTGRTGKEIRREGRDVQVVALYLLTSPQANMIGLYYLPLPTLCHEVGMHQRAAKRALDVLGKLSFAHYDDETEYVWVPEMARFQLGEQLSASDNNATAVQNLYLSLSPNPFLPLFYQKYARRYFLEPRPDHPDVVRELPQPTTEPEPTTANGRRQRSGTPPDSNVKRIIDRYHDLFVQSHGKKPMINGPKDGATIKRLLTVYEADYLLTLLDAFFASKDPFIRRAGHSIGVFASQINKLIAVTESQETPQYVPSN